MHQFSIGFAVWLVRSWFKMGKLEPVDLVTEDYDVSLSQWIEWYYTHLFTPLFIIVWLDHYLTDVRASCQSLLCSLTGILAKCENKIDWFEETTGKSVMCERKYPSDTRHCTISATVYWINHIQAYWPDWRISRRYCTPFFMIHFKMCAVLVNCMFVWCSWLLWLTDGSTLLQNTIL